MAANVLEHGCGALNIDGCRVGGEQAWRYPHGPKGNTESSCIYGGGDGLPRREEPLEGPQGRWPANIVHDGSDDVVAAFPQTESGKLEAHHIDSGKRAGILGDYAGSTGRESFGDSGSAARFFYTAKADAEDRLGSKHPTVKPVDLMAWLCRLVTPPGGTVLDPFAGTGTTGAACLREGFGCILIEREERFVADIHRRLAWAQGNGRLTVLEKARDVDPGKAAGADLPLFGGGAA